MGRLRGQSGLFPNLLQQRRNQGSGPRPEQNQGDDERLERRTGFAKRKRPSGSERPGQPQAARCQQIRSQVRKIADSQRGGDPSRRGAERTPGADHNRHRRMRHAAMAKHSRNARGDRAHPPAEPGFRVVDIGKQRPQQGQAEAGRSRCRQTKAGRRDEPSRHPECHVRSRHHRPVNLLPCRSGHLRPGQAERKSPPLNVRDKAAALARLNEKLTKRNYLELSCLTSTN